ncbi:MAG: hypothetical protein O9344_06125 [Phreatobacter sp.]|nr:hypothetical protein [Phreatobacter sp.]
MDRKGSAAGAGKTPRKRAAKPAAASRPTPSPLPPGVWGRALRAGLITTAIALIAALPASLLAGHAPSWRSLQVICLQALPLLPGIALAWWLLEALRARFPGPPLAFWLGLAFIGTLGVMLVAPGLVFAVLQRSTAFAEDVDGEMGLLHHLLGVGSALYLWATTAFRLWWPFGLALPVVVTALAWRAFRRPA